jgi:hypothetical protein
MRSEIPALDEENAAIAAKVTADMNSAFRTETGREAFMRGILEYIAKGADPQAHIVARNALAKLEQNDA